MHQKLWISVYVSFNTTLLIPGPQSMYLPILYGSCCRPGISRQSIPSYLAPASDPRSNTYYGHLLFVDRSPDCRGIGSGISSSCACVWISFNLLYTTTRSCPESFPILSVVQPLKSNTNKLIY
jgi:hypothetical protein